MAVPFFVHALLCELSNAVTLLKGLSMLSMDVDAHGQVLSAHGGTMLHLPDLPLGRTTRYIECVSCQERFAITQEYKCENFKGSRSIQDGDAAWSVVPEHRPYTRQRHVLPFAQRRVSPEPPAQVRNESRSERAVGPNQLNSINCPRCGADNRNWAQLQDHPRSRPWLDGALTSYLPHAALVSVVVGSFLMLACFVVFWAIDFLFFGLPLFIAVLLAGTLPIILIGNQWRTFLQHTRAKKFLPRYEGATPMIGQMVIIGFVLVVGMPLFLYIVLPHVWHFLMPNSQFIPFVSFSAVVRQFQFSNITEYDLQAATEFWRNSKIVVLFLAGWSILTGITYLFSCVVGALNVQQMIGRIEPQLPPPIYQSVANMTRIVIWEAQHALDVNEFLGDVRWERVEQQPDGGLELQGALREMPLFNGRGERTDDMVNAHCYFIQTDRWGRVREARMHQRRVPAALNTHRQMEVLTPPLQHPRNRQIPVSANGH